MQYAHSSLLKTALDLPIFKSTFDSIIKRKVAALKHLAGSIRDGKVCTNSLTLNFCSKEGRMAGSVQLVCSCQRKISGRYHTEALRNLHARVAEGERASTGKAESILIYAHLDQKSGSRIRTH